MVNSNLIEVCTALSVHIKYILIVVSTRVFLVVYTATGKITVK